MRYFSDSYIQARTRLRSAIEKYGRWHAYPIAHDPQLTIDVARIGPEDAKNLLILSSGTHGIEGFFGSALQLSILENQVLPPKDTALLIIHAINPFGFANLRRVNEDNIDLNRNFMRAGEAYSGADPGYHKLNEVLNPETPPERELFLLRTAINILRYGFSSLKNSIAQGQYEYPKGLFFGGKASSSSMRIIQENLQTWVGKAEKIVHLDMHTGLGKWGSYVLASTRALPPETLAQFIPFFGAEHVQQLSSSGVLYEIRGEFSTFCRSLFPDKHYIPFLAEFGTYNIIKVLQALRHENRVWHWGGDAQEAKKILKEAFIPSSPGWEDIVLQRGVAIVEQGYKALGHFST